MRRQWRSHSTIKRTEKNAFSIDRETPGNALCLLVFVCVSCGHSIVHLKNMENILHLYILYGKFFPLIHCEKSRLEQWSILIVMMIVVKIILTNYYCFTVA